jgi:hypothetical protein
MSSANQCSLANVTYSVGVTFYLWLSRVMSDITNQIELGYLPVIFKTVLGLGQSFVKTYDV